MSLSAYKAEGLPPTAVQRGSPTRKNRRTPTLTKSGPAAANLGTIEKSGPAQQLGYAVRGQRQALGWTIAEAAAWCGVGTRFLLDLELGKSTVQLDRALAVAARFGVDFQISTRSRAFGISEGISAAHPVLATASPENQRQVDVFAPPGCANPSLWLGLCHAAQVIAGGCGLPVLSCTPVRQSGKLTQLRMDLSDWQEGPASGAFAALTRRKDMENRTPWAQPATRGLREEEGGPGIEAAVHFFQQHSAVPMVDIANLVRWVVLSNVLLDSGHHLGRLRVVEICPSQAEGAKPRPATTPAVRLAAFGELMCMSGMFEAQPHKGLRIGSAWPEIYLRADHWKRLADIAGIHPKVIFQLMRELSARVPGLLDRALEQSLGALPTQGPWVEVVKNVRTASARMSDLTLAASRHVSGLNTRTQPKVEPVATRLVIQPTKRFLPVVDDE